MTLLDSIRRHASRLLRAIALGVAALVVAFGWTPACAAMSPAVRVGPHGNLTNGESVTVHWSGFHDHSQRYRVIYECRPNFDTIGWVACSQLSGDTTRGRRGQTTVEVVTGQVGLGDGTCGTSATDRDCLILVRGLTPRMTDTSIAYAPIRFAVPG